MTTLKVSPELALPLDAVTGTYGILATKGSGKSNAAVVMAEEMYDAGVPWVAVDPKGDWYGIRSSADGKGPGLPIVVFGGRHGDVPLEPTAGALLADLVLRERLSCVLDVSQFTKADVVRFLLAFGERLFRHADDDGAEPLHLFLEEAHEYLPQQVTGDVSKLVGAWQRIVKQGRFKGLGCTMISQRSSSLNKDVLELIDTLVVLRTIGPRSRDAIKAWVRDQDVDQGLLASLPTLADGEAWVWSPGELRIMERIHFRRRRTFDSGATPKVGQARRPPATLADVDLAAVKEQMAETIEKAKADDPKELRKQIKELERELTQRPTEAVVETVTEIERVEVPVLDADLVERLEAVLVPFGQLEEAIGSARAAQVHWEREAERLDRQEVPRARTASGGARAVERARPSQRPDPPQRREPRRAPVSRPAPAEGDVAVTGPMRKLLAVLATYGPRTKRQLAMQAGYSAKGGGFNNPLSALRSSGLVERGDPIAITQAGVDALGDFEPLPTGQALVDHWMGQLGGPERKILQPLIDVYPNTMSKEELADVAGYAPVGGGFNNPLSRLRTLELVTRGPDIGLTDDFAEAIA